MKLIEILVRDLPGSGGWPEYAEGVVQDSNDSELYFFKGSQPKNDSGSSWWFEDENPENTWIFHNEKFEIAEDHASTIVTREEYEAALAASKEMLVNKPVAWDGQGLPPVGAECEYKDYSTSEWHAVTITYCSNQVVVFSSNHKTFKGEPVEISKDLVIDTPEFRPVRTEKQRKRKFALDAIAEICRSSASNGHSAELIYAAIEAGSIPGVKLEAPDED